MMVVNEPATRRLARPCVACVPGAVFPQDHPQPLRGACGAVEEMAGGVESGTRGDRMGRFPW